MSINLKEVLDDGIHTLTGLAGTLGALAASGVVVTAARR